MSEAIEDYAKAIYALGRRGGGTATTNAVADRLGASAGSLSAMIKKFAERGLADHEPYSARVGARRGRLGLASRPRAASSPATAQARSGRQPVRS